MEWKKVFEPLGVYRSPHVLMKVQFSGAVLSTVVNVALLTVALIFIRSFFSSGFSGEIDEWTKIILISSVGILSGVFAVPFGRVDIETGKDVKLFARLRRYYIYLIISFYIVIVMSAIIIVVSSSIGYPVIFNIRQSIPGLNDISSLFLFMSIVSSLSIVLSYFLTQHITDKNVWNLYSKNKWKWFPFYVMVLAIAATVAVF